MGKSGTIEVNSDSLKIDSNVGIATFDGNVEIKLNKIILKAQKITVTYTTDENSKQEITEILAINDVVVVLPCVPAIAIDCFSRINSPSISARWTIGRNFLFASTSSSLFLDIAVETTIILALIMFDFLGTVFI